MAVDRQWPIDVGQVRDALGFKPDQGTPAALELYALAACERIDTHTGRDQEPTRHERADGQLPIIFVLAARETAKLWYQQATNGPRAQPGQVGDQVGPPMGADLPYKVVGWLAPFPAPPGIA